MRREIGNSQTAVDAPLGNAAFAPLVRNLTDGHPPRVWSLIVTMFGDLAQDPAAQLSGAMLRRMTQAIGIKPEATRVALHRLRKDNWLVSHRSGRNSAYALTEWGLSQTRLATPRIYATGPVADAAWLSAGALGDTPADTPVYPVAAGLFVSPARLRHPEVISCPIEPDANTPDWMRAALCPPDMVAMGHVMHTRLKTTRDMLATFDDLTVVQRSVLRVLIVHGWRRLVLRSPVLPDGLFPQDWTGPQCRALVGALLEGLGPPNLPALERDSQHAHSG